MGKSSKPTDIESRNVYRLLAAAAAAVHFFFCRHLIGPMALDLDAVNLTYAIHTFDITKLSPHPPGYLPYVGLLRLVHAIIGGDPLRSVQLTALLFSVGTVLLTPLIAERLGANVRLRTIVLFLAAIHPFLIFHGSDGQTHASEGFVAALLFHTLAVPSDRRKTILLVGLLVALGTALRPSFLLMTTGPVVFVYRRNRGALMMIAGMTLLCTAAWLIPTILLTGGFEVWRLAHQAFIIDPFVDIGHKTLHSAFAVAVWSLLLVAPVLPAILRIKTAPRILTRFIAFGMGPAVLFFLMTFVSEPGYLQAMVPLFLLLTGYLVYEFKRPLIACILALGVELGILMLPPGAPLGMKLPTIQEMVQREVAAESMLKAISGRVTPEHRLLFITDYDGIPLQRQLPLLRPHTDVLWAHRGPTGRVQSLSFGTAASATPIPGPVTLAKGPPARFDTKRSYHYIVLDPMLTNETRSALSMVSRCPIPMQTAKVMTYHVPTQCFSKGKVILGGHTVTFGALPIPGLRLPPTR